MHSGELQPAGRPFAETAVTRTVSPGPMEAAEFGVPDFRRSPWGVTLLRLAVHALLLLAVTIGLLGVVPHFEKVFADFQMKLPILTELVIDLASAMVQFAFLVPAALAALLALDGAILYYLQKNGQRSLARLWFFLVLLLILAVAAGLALAVFMPLFQLMQGLSR